MLISLLSCSPGEWAGRHSSAAGSLLQGQNFCPLHVPHTNVPPLHWCDWWAGSTYTFDERSADSCGPCVGPLGQGLQGCCDVSPIPPTANHFSLPQNLCSTAKGAFLFSILKWLLCLLRMVFQELWLLASVCNYKALRILWRWIQAGYSSLEVSVAQEQHEICIIIMSFCLFWPCTRWSYVSYA